MNETLISIGPDLIKHSRSIDQATKFGPITQLFPFIYEASQTMGVREISRWLSENKKISISPSTISRALRFSEPQWEGFSTIIEPRMRNVEAFAPSLDLRQFMFDTYPEHQIASIMCSAQDIIKHPTEDLIETADACFSSLEFLDSTWFSLSVPTRLNCKPFLFDDEDELSEDEP